MSSSEEPAASRGRSYYADWKRKEKATILEYATTRSHVPSGSNTASRVFIETKEDIYRGYLDSFEALASESDPQSIFLRRSWRDNDFIKPSSAEDFWKVVSSELQFTIVPSTERVLLSAQRRQSFIEETERISNQLELRRHRIASWGQGAADEEEDQDEARSRKRARQHDVVDPVDSEVHEANIDNLPIEPEKPAPVCSHGCGYGTEAKPCSTPKCGGFSCHMCSINTERPEAEGNVSWRICLPCARQHDSEVHEGGDEVDERDSEEHEEGAGVDSEEQEEEGIHGGWRSATEALPWPIPTQAERIVLMNRCQRLADERAAGGSSASALSSTAIDEMVRANDAMFSMQPSW